MSRLKVAGAVADEARGRNYEVAAACRVLGFDQTVMLAAVGLLTGSMESGDLAKLLTLLTLVPQRGLELRRFLQEIQRVR